VNRELLFLLFSFYNDDEKPETIIEKNECQYIFYLGTGEPCAVHSMAAVSNSFTTTLEKKFKTIINVPHFLTGLTQQNDNAIIAVLQFYN
jgi:hypothetical protein